MGASDRVGSRAGDMAVSFGGVRGPGRGKGLAGGEVRTLAFRAAGRVARRFLLAADGCGLMPSPDTVRFANGVLGICAAAARFQRIGCAGVEPGCFADDAPRKFGCLMHRRASWRLRPGGVQGQEFGVVGISPLGAEGGEELLWSELTRPCPDVSHRAEEAICEAGRAGDNALGRKVSE